MGWSAAFRVPDHPDAIPSTPLQDQYRSALPHVYAAPADSGNAGSSAGCRASGRPSSHPEKKERCGTGSIELGEGLLLIAVSPCLRVQPPTLVPPRTRTVPWGGAVVR